MVGLKFKHKVKRKILYDLITSQQKTINTLCKTISKERDKITYFQNMVDDIRQSKMDQALSGEIPPVLPEMKKLDLQEALKNQSKFDLQDAMREEGYEKYDERESSP